MVGNIRSFVVCIVSVMNVCYNLVCLFKVSFICPTCVQFYFPFKINLYKIKRMQYSSDVISHVPVSCKANGVGNQFGARLSK